VKRQSGERGIALVLALLLTAALSVLATSLMFLSQTETYASMNYRMMSQARYAGEAGIHKAADFLLDRTQYPDPTSADLLNAAICDYHASPVTCNGQPVILSAVSTQSSNYPVSSVQTAFNTAAQGTLTAGNARLTYGAYAELISMQRFDSIAGPGVAQIWKVTGIGGLNGTRNATVEVQAIIEKPKVPGSTYGAFATDDACGALTFAGNMNTNSYDSGTVSGSTSPTMLDTGGDVGTNGNLAITGNTTINGNLYTPRTGVGDCSDGSITAIDNTGNVSVTGAVAPLPKGVAYPAPDRPAPSLLPAVDISALNATTCASLGLTATNCNVSGSNLIINADASLPIPTLPSITMHAGLNLVFVAGSPAEFNINSLTLVGGAAVRVEASAPTQTVTVNVSGYNPDGSDIDTPIDFGGGTFASPIGCATCSDYDASMLQFMYGGTGDIILTGNDAAAATFYAPEADVSLQGTADLYGAVLGSRIDVTSTSNIYYDQRLTKDFWVTGPAMPTTFSWKRD
jgi:hypothetical protein